MVRFPSEWVQTFGVNLVSALPPGLGARFRYHARLRPQPSFSTIVDRCLSSDPELRVREVGELRRMVTREGEYAAWVALDGAREGARAKRYIGAVFMDDFAAVLDAIAIVPAHFACVEELSLDLLCSATFQMTQRPRPFFYVPPAGWQGIPSGPTANWYPPDFPNNLSTLAVSPAISDERGLDPVRELAQLGAGLTVTNGQQNEITSEHGVAGLALSLSGLRAGRAEPIHRELVAYGVAPHIYRFQLETTNAAHLLELRAEVHTVARSFHPLPQGHETRSGRAFTAISKAFDHWAM